MRGLFLAATLFLAPAVAAAQPIASPPPVPRGVATLPTAPPGVSGWMLADLDSGAVLSARNAGRAFVPASVAKLVTALYALERLGPRHRFVTRLMATGPVINGTLHGDLVLAGAGDAELDSDALARLVARLGAIGVTRVDGRFLIDPGALPAIPAIAPSQPVDAAYNPAISGLNLNFNRVRLSWGRGADPPALTAMAERTAPPVSNVRVEPVPGARGPALSVGPGGEIWRLPAASLRGRGARWLPVRRPAAYAGEAFRALADAAGIALPAPEIDAAPARVAVLARESGRPLWRVLTDMLRHSTNLTAEVVGLAASGAATGTPPATLARSGARMGIWVRAELARPAAAPAFRLVNHSGLTLESRLRPEAMVGLLVAAAARPAPPGAGHPRLPGAAAALLPRVRVAADGDGIDHARLEIRAKSGTMDQVRGLAGYIATPGGRRLAFAIFSNRLEARRPGRRGIDRGWMARARHFERALIRAWVRRADGQAR